MWKTLNWGLKVRETKKQNRTSNSKWATHYHYFFNLSIFSLKIFTLSSKLLSKFIFVWSLVFNFRIYKLGFHWISISPPGNAGFKPPSSVFIVEKAQRLQPSCEWIAAFWSPESLERIISTMRRSELKFQRFSLSEQCSNLRYYLVILTVRERVRRSSLLSLTNLNFYSEADQSRTWTDVWRNVAAS